MTENPEYTFRYMRKDHTGQLHNGIVLVERYLDAAVRQHALMMEAWQAKQPRRALVELHFFLISVDRVKDGIALAAKVLGNKMANHLSALDLTFYKQARDHFEHIDDRLYLSRKNAPKPIEENGFVRTIHFGLSSKDMTFRWSDQRIDISGQFLDVFVAWAKEACAIADQSLVEL
ncbi:hypothetical protein CK228_01890 [Mesorhizobium sp. WSM4312]|uniref:hypothetical protein n=1 Tax=unclassified Mesorhizobium TaxID=325217 RepID=UPI000BAFFFB0|nr:MULTISPECIES: hypothetical protein [unclassified Mesorhizobium]PBB27583.1 hypothetical protein CK232_05400 [Mesorhizobium sp. WSM4304]PBB70434.1 hypothetical protein CK228_01890 [Mesorhizobium sp. WSM4312]PBB77185.1 hypothetical protein CK227_01095 [Mesorhizobium sp. WSM4308]TRC79680.1 hypothetical protein FJV81_06385 [Mesorhizobium sp. WSM4315]TRC88556.1 hypothetical protein FJV83_02490 [Mesorhizobium sp. WSM4307]